jgi:hypothetical protein
MDCVASHPRSGSRLVGALLNAGGSEAAAHEYLAKLSSMGVSVPTLYYEGKVGLEAVLDLLEHYEHTPTPQVRIDSNWKLTWILEPFLQRYPQARVLHLVRDPAATVRSCHNLDYYGVLQAHPAFAEDHARNYWLRWLPRVRRDDWDALSPFERNCALWAESQRLLREGLARHARVLRVRLEDLLTDDAVVARIFEFFGLPQPAVKDVAGVLAARINERRGVKARVETNRGDMLPSFEEWPAPLRARFAALCGEQARALGYDIA